jgi:hypothetical protein
MLSDSTRSPSPNPRAAIRAAIPAELPARTRARIELFAALRARRTVEPLQPQQMAAVVHH